MISIVLLLLSLLQAQEGTISGIVTDSATKAPLYGVQVGLVTREDDPNARLLYSTTTDDNGRFRISAPAGDYTLRAQRDGYFGAPRNGLSAGYGSRHIVLASQQQVSNVAISLQPGGAISGRFLDQFGRTNIRLSVTAYRVTYDLGRRSLTQVQTAATNDRGEFRLYWMPPGEYIVSGSSRSTFTTAVQAASPRYAVRTFFPGTSDLSKAVTVAVQSGADVGGLNFAEETSPGVAIAGRVINPYLKPPPAPPPGTTEPSYVATPNISLALRGSPLGESLSLFGNGATAAEQRQGVFKFTGVAPGTYDVYVVANDGGPTTTASFGGVAPLEVGSQDVTVAVNVMPPVELKGRITVTGGGPHVDFGSIALKPKTGVPGNAGATTPPPAKIAATGEFSFAKIVMPIAYGLSVEVPDGLFLADIRQGQRSIYSSATIELDGTAPEPVQIFLGRNPGSLRGRLEKPAADPFVVLVPEPGLRSNPMLYFTVRPEDDGTFVLKNVAPGSYKLFAWNGVLSTAWMNAEFIKTFETRGIPLKIEQKETQLSSPVAILE
jgi:Carboxypeptidase regulatory-like domain